MKEKDLLERIERLENDLEELISFLYDLLYIRYEMLDMSADEFRRIRDLLR